MMRKLILCLILCLIPALCGAAFVRPIVSDIVQPVVSDLFGSLETWATPADIPEAEATALQSFYDATAGDSWTDSSDWGTSSTADDWYGVTVTGGHVTGLALANNNLAGDGADTLPTTLTSLDLWQNSGLLGIDVSGLTSLSDIYLGGCDINTNCTLANVYKSWVFSDAKTGTADALPILYSGQNDSPLKEYGSTGLSSGYASFTGSSMLVPAAGTQKNIQAYDATAMDATFLFHTQIPAAQGAHDGAGFTITGLAKAPNGQWVCGNDGRVSSGSTNLCSIVILSEDFTTKIAEYDQSDISGIGTIQGVAVDTSTDPATIWYVDYANKQLTHLTWAGASVGDDIDISALYPASNPNGLAYDSENNALWVCNSASTGTAYLLDCEDGSTIKTLIDVQLDSGPDQLFYDNDTELLYITSGANEADGWVSIYTTADETAAGTYGRRLAIWSMPNATAIEGIYLDGRDLYIAQDGGFHPTTGALETDVVSKYHIKTLENHRSNILTIALKIKHPSVIDGYGILISSGQYRDESGWGLYVYSATDIKFAARDAAGTQAGYGWTNTISTSWARLIIKVNQSADTINVYLNGTSIASSTTTGFDTLTFDGFQIAPSFAIGGAAFGVSSELLRADNTDIAAAVVGGDVDVSALDAFLSGL